jgi:HAD superfamily hydrolase (TIGR01509 family)
VAFPSAVIFDNDGLLLDTEAVWTRAEEDLFQRRGLAFTLAHKQEVVGTSAQIAGAIFERRLGEPGRAAEIVAELDELVFEELSRGVDAMPGALELVADLRERGTPIAIASNSPARFIAAALDLVGLGDVFGAAVSGHDVPEPKPAPDVYLVACDLLGVAPGPHVVVLEDSPTGVAAGVAAGLTVIGVPSLEGVELPEAHSVFGSLADADLRARVGLN